MQDADYLASLQADKQKELNSFNKTESHSSQEEESCKKMLEKKVIHFLSLRLFDFVLAVSFGMNMKHNISLHLLLEEETQIFNEYACVIIPSTEWIYLYSRVLER